MGDARRRRLLLMREKGCTFEEADAMIGAGAKPREKSGPISRIIGVFWPSVQPFTDDKGRKMEQHRTYRRGMK
jgi:hypothetical protein